MSVDKFDENGYPLCSCADMWGRHIPDCRVRQAFDRLNRRVSEDEAEVFRLREENADLCSEIRRLRRAGLIVCVDESGVDIAREGK